MQNRRHQDNFTPSQKNILPLNRYDEADRVVARALYAFNGQTARELSFRKGDLINVRRQIDSNWYEGEIHGRIGLFPYNYVEVRHVFVSCCIFAIFIISSSLLKLSLILSKCNLMRALKCELIFTIPIMNGNTLRCVAVYFWYNYYHILIKQLQNLFKHFQI